MIRKIICFALLACTLVTALAVAVGANTYEYQVSVQAQTYYSGALSDTDDSEELFKAYAERALYPDRAISFWGTNARERLSDNDKKLYDHLKENIALIANGTSQSSTISLSTDTLNSWGVKTKWTNTDLSVEYITDSSIVSDLFWKQFDVSAVESALLFDCPYEFYWFDKTQGFSWGTSLSLSGYGQNKITSAAVSGPVFIFSVCKAYRSDAYDSQSPTLDQRKTGATTVAIATAASIVEEYKSRSDYEKLVLYKEKICDLTSYATDVTGSAEYGDPWQIIYVFDNDPSTNVVCEGYSKAFQYLCDLTRFDHHITCYTVSGTMSGGNHMWNTVTMDDGKTYLVDVTNSDSGMAGSSGTLFLAGCSGSVNTGYVFRTGGNTLSYLYDETTVELWGEDADGPLCLSSSSYAVTFSPISISVPNSIVYSGRPITAGQTNADVTYSIAFSGYTLSHSFYLSNTSTVPVIPHDAGEYLLSVTATKAGSQTYKKNVWITVEKAELTVTPHNMSLIYGNAPQDSVTADIVGFVGTDTYETSDLKGKLTADHTYSQYGNIGSYSFTVGGYVSSNYNITYNKGALTVLPATVRVSWFNTETVYGDTDTVTATLSGVLNNDDVSVKINGISEKVGIHIVSASLVGDGAENYVIARDTETNNITVSKRPLTLDVHIPDITYGDAFPKIQDIPENASISYAGNGYSSTEPPTYAGKYTVYVTYETETEIYTGSNTFTVRKKELTVEGIQLEADRVYRKDDTDIKVEGLDVGGIVNGDDVQIDLGVGLFAKLPDSSAGAYDSVLLDTAEISLVGNESANYTFSGSKQEITVTVTVHPRRPESITVIVNDTKFNGSPASPDVTVMADGEEIPKSEYDIIYKNNDRIGQATVTVTDRAGGNYEIPKTSQPFEITEPTKDTEKNGKDTEKHADTNAATPITVEQSGGCGSSVSALPLVLIILAALPLVIKRKRNKN